MHTNFGQAKRKNIQDRCRSWYIAYFYKGSNTVIPKSNIIFQGMAKRAYIPCPGLYDYPNFIVMNFHISKSTPYSVAFLDFLLFLCKSTIIWKGWQDLVNDTYAQQSELILDWFCPKPLFLEWPLRGTSSKISVWCEFWKTAEVDKWKIERVIL